MGKRNDTAGMNKYQKAARRPGEKRVGREDIEELLVLSNSDDPEDRYMAASHLCPCHVRHRDERIWAALYRMMEDPETRVRRAAWHTLEDGGCPTDPAFEPVLKRTLEQEEDRTVLGYARHFAQPYLEKERVALKLAGHREMKPRGKCDFCGKTNVPVVKDLDTMIPTGGMPRAALICDDCAKSR